MSIKTNLNIAPYFDDYDISKKYYRVLFKPSFAVQARELNQLQTTLQNQIEQFGENIYKEGSIIKGSTFTELRNLKYVKVVDQIAPVGNTSLNTPESFIERTVINDDIINEYYYEIEDNQGLNALIVSGTSGFQSRAPDLNTFFVVYLNTSNTNKKQYEPSDTLNIREYILRTDELGTETIIDNGIVATTSVASFSDPVGDSFGLNASEGVIFQRGHFLFVDDQTIIVEKYIIETEEDTEIKPNGISVGYVVDESIVTSQQNIDLLDNANGSPNQNAPGADRLVLIPRLVAINTEEAEQDSNFFILRRYENGEAVETRDVSEFNSIAKELARRTYETNGDYTKKDFDFNITKKTNTNKFSLEMSEGVAYSKGYRISNDTKRIFEIPDVTSTEKVSNQSVNFVYGGYCKIINATGRVTLGEYQNVQLVNTSEVVIGSAVVKNYTRDKIYLFAIRMIGSNSFSQVRYVKEGSNGLIEIEPKIINSTGSTLIFDFNVPFVKTIDDMSFYIRKTTQDNTNSSGDLVIAPPVGFSFDLNSLNDLLIIKNSNNQPVNINNLTTIINNEGKLFIDTDEPSSLVTVYYNIKVNNPIQKVKNVFDLYVKTTYNTLKTKYTLGLSDCISLLSIKDPSGNEYVNSFKLIKNQRDDFYDHSYIEKIPGTSSPGNNTLLTIKVRGFRVDSGPEINFFTVNSYDSIDITEIPQFESISGKIYNLKNCLDFRPHRAAIAAYSTNESGATVLSTIDPELPVSIDSLFLPGVNYGIPAINTSGNLDIEYYDSRTDYIIGSSYGRFKYVSGDEVGNSVGKLETGENTIIAEIKIPGYPLLDKEDAYKQNRQSETIFVTPKTVKTYTMKDIDSLSKKIERLEYYTALSILEKSAKDLVIKDENGLNRFKNGIMVDNFENLLIADVADANFNASVDFTEKALYPSITQFPLDLKVKSFNGTQSFDGKNSITTLSSNRLAKFLSQQYATNFRTCTSNLYNYKGVGRLIPEYDFAHDTVTTPKSFEIDLATPFAQYTEALSEFVPLTSTQQNLLNTTVNTNVSRSGRTTTTETVTTQDFENVYKELSSNVKTQETFVGDFVTNVSFKPYIKSREVQIELYGLRPNTRHYFYFDEVDITEFVAPGINPGDELSSIPGVTDPQVVIQRGKFGQEVRTNEFGELYAIFKIPAGRFLVGERELIVADVPGIENIETAAASQAKLKYNAYNFSSDKVGLTISTRVPEFDVAESRTTRSVTTRSVSTVTRRRRNSETRRNSDPIAQTFFVKETMTRGAESLYVGRIDIYFKRKSFINGISVQIREVENGYPSSEILPFGKKHLKSSQVLVSDDASIATTVIFDAPVRLDAEKEYCFVVQPDADDPDYLIFIQKVGGLDLTTGNPINADWGDGVLFTSTNNRAWKSYQDEDIKFDLYRYNFNINSGTLELETRENEFLQIENSIGNFIDDEIVYTFKGTSTFTVNLVVGNRTISGSGLSIYNVGDYVYVENSVGEKQLFRVISSTSSSILVDKPPLFGGTFQSRPVVSGKIVYYNSRKNNFVVLENSSARDGRIFAAGDTLRGIDSEAIATISSVSNPELSYIQTMISRIIDSNTNVKISIKAVDPLAVENTPYTSAFNFANKKTFNEKGCKIYSRSNDINSEKNLKFVLTFEKEPLETTTPIVDTETAKVFAYIYNITNDPETTSRYISKKVELKEGFDAEDFNLYLTGYRPIGSDIKVYLKVKNSDDAVSLKNNPWIEMEKIEGNNLFSSRSNTNDYKEFVFGIPDNSNNKTAGVITYTNEAGTYSSFRSFLIRIDLISDNVGSVPKVADYRGIAFE
jgi:hypothetical protein